MIANPVGHLSLDVTLFYFLYGMPNIKFGVLVFKIITGGVLLRKDK